MNKPKQPKRQGTIHRNSPRPWPADGSTLDIWFENSDFPFRHRFVENVVLCESVNGSEERFTSPYVSEQFANEIHTLHFRKTSSRTAPWITMILNEANGAILAVEHSAKRNPKGHSITVNLFCGTIHGAFGYHNLMDFPVYEPGHLGMDLWMPDDPNSGRLSADLSGTGRLREWTASRSQPRAQTKHSASGRLMTIDDNTSVLPWSGSTHGGIILLDHDGRKISGAAIFANDDGVLNRQNVDGIIHDWPVTKTLKMCCS